jgi:hypothetical protein
MDSHSGITMYYQELYMRFTQASHPCALRGIQADSLEIINSHRMEKLFKKGHHRVISQFNSIQVTEHASHIVPPSPKIILDKYPKVLEIPTTLPTSKGKHDHRISLILRSQPLNVHPYIYPFAQKNETKMMVQELLEVGVIQPQYQPIFFTNTWCMCPK